MELKQLFKMIKLLSFLNSIILTSIFLKNDKKCLLKKICIIFNILFILSKIFCKKKYK